MECIVNGFYLHFTGQVTIEFHVEKETNFIVLHIQDLNITEKVILFRSKQNADIRNHTELAIDACLHGQPFANMKKEKFRQLVAEIKLLTTTLSSGR